MRQARRHGHSAYGKRAYSNKKLWENRGRIVSFDSLCMAAWGEDYYGHENTLTVHIRRLREKLEDTPSAPKYLLTVRGLGYRLAVRDE